MKIYITKSFEIMFLKEFNFEKILDNFIELLRYKNHTLIDLKFPYKKFKYNIGNLTVRGIVFCGVINVIIPLFIAKKSDKKYGNNLVLDGKIEQLLEDRLIKLKKDLEKGNFKSYDIM